MPILALLSGFSGLATTKQVFEWIDPNGNHTVLNTPWDYDGRFMPPVEYLSDKLPGRDGEFFRSVRHTPRTIKIPVYITAGCQYTSADLRVSVRDLVNAMDPSNGIGTLRVTNPGGDQRELPCRYLSGLEFPEKFGSTSSLNLQKVTINLIAHQPYWQGINPTINDFTTGVPVLFFPIFPLRLASSQVFTSTTINNPGNKPSWPLWRIVGPGSVIKLSNLTTGQKLEFSNAGGLILGVGESIYIDTSEGIKTATRNDNTNLFKYLSNDSTMWAIPPGDSSMELQMAGATIDSSLRLEYTPTYLTV